MKTKTWAAAIGLTAFFLAAFHSGAEPSPQQLANWLKRFPDADTNKDGVLSLEEASAYQKKLRGKSGKGQKPSRGAPRSFSVNPGWANSDFPESAVFTKSPAEIAEIFAKASKGNSPILSGPKPEDGSLRLAGTGHSFMAPGYRALPAIAKAAGFGDQILHTHVGGGITGSARYKWEQENGIFQFDGKPLPKLLASIANSKWDAMVWGPYFNDRTNYYSCWIDFCLKYNPAMKFYLSDAWIQLYQLDKTPESEDFFTQERVDEMNRTKRGIYIKLVESLNEAYPGKVYILPTCDAMTLAAKRYLKDDLPGVEGFNRIIGGKEKSLWRDHLGHLGPGFDRLEGYVFYATLYGKSPELIEEKIDFNPRIKDTAKDFPSPELDRIFRKIAWESVTHHPLSGVTDKDGDGIADRPES